MKKFILKSTPYFLLIVLYIGIGEFLLYRIRENIPLSITIDQQVNAKQESYYGRTLFADVLSNYKYNTLLKKKATVITLGQSIVLSYRDFFFHPYEKEFYNTGLMVRNVNDLNYFVDQIKQKNIVKPEFMVFGLDFGMMLNLQQLDSKKWIENLDEDPVLNPKEHIRTIQQVYLDKQTRHVPSTDFGFGKKGMEGTGYRRDGSFDYKWELDLFLKDSTHVEGPHKEELKHKQLIFVSPMKANPLKVEKLVQVLHEFRNMGIEMLIYCPPLSDDFFNEAIKDPEYAAFWKEYLALQDRLEKENFDIVKFTTPARMGLNDYYMNNADHPGDVIVAQQFYDYCVSAQRKNKFIDKIDLQALKNRLASPYKTPLSFMEDSLLYPGYIKK